MVWSLQENDGTPGAHAEHWWGPNKEKKVRSWMAGRGPREGDWEDRIYLHVLAEPHNYK